MTGVQTCALPISIVVDSAGRLGPALNFDTNTRQVQKSHNQHFSVTEPFANVDKRIDPSFDDVIGNESLSEKLESPKPHQDLSPQLANRWKDLVIGVSEEERETFVRTPSPQTTPDDEPIELDLSDSAFGAQRKIGHRKRLVNQQVINSRTGSVKVKSLMDHQLYSPETTANGSNLLVASIFNNKKIIARAMPVQNMGKTNSVPRGEWTTADQEFPEGIYLQFHVTAP